MIRSTAHKDVADAVLAEALLGMELLSSSREMLLSFAEHLGLTVVEGLLNACASEIAGTPHPGKKSGIIRHWGSQRGSVRLGPSKTRIRHPRLRDRSTNKEVEVPAYELLKKDPNAKRRVVHAALRGVSTRDYKEVVAGSAEALGVSKSTISRQFVEETAARVEELANRPLPCRMLAVVMDGIRFEGHLLVGAIGVSEEGKKHFLGLALGATENAETVKSLLTNLRERGLLPNTLFVIDGAKALKSAILDLFGKRALIQRCRYHKKKNVIDRLPQRMAKYFYAKMAAAYKLGPKEGMQRMLEVAKELSVNWPGAAASLREGLEETFTVNTLALPPLLASSLGTSNLIESAHSMIRDGTRRLKKLERGEDVQRWVWSAFLEAEGRMRTLRGYKDLWMLRAMLDEEPSKEEGVA